MGFELISSCKRVGSCKVGRGFSSSKKRGLAEEDKGLLKGEALYRLAMCL